MDRGVDRLLGDARDYEASTGRYACAVVPNPIERDEIEADVANEQAPFSWSATRTCLSDNRSPAAPSGVL